MFKKKKKETHHHCRLQDAAQEKAFSERTVLILRKNLKNLKQLGQVFGKLWQMQKLPFSLRVRNEYQANFSIVGHPRINSWPWKCTLLTPAGT